MTTQLTQDGHRFLARVLIGDVTPTYGLYIGYSNKAVATAPDANLEYFEQLANGTSTGYARIPILSASLLENDILFTGMLTSADLIGGKPTRNSVLTTATLVNLGQTQANDIFIYNAVLQQPVKVVDGTYITVHVRMSLGSYNA